MTSRFPALDFEAFSTTRDALHAYSGIPGGWMSTSRQQRKHWWHASLRPSLTGATTGVIYTEETSFEIELNFRESALLVRTASGESLSVELRGQPAAELAATVREFLVSAGIPTQLTVAADHANTFDRECAYPDYSTEQANKLARAMSAITASLVSFRAGIREETSPIGIWPHHFDLAMLWLPGDKVVDQDPGNEEYADKQMNFGFTFGDGGIPEPYFYITAYPSPDAFATLKLPKGTQWHSEGFTGAVLTYRRLLETSDPEAYLLELWNHLLAAGKTHLVEL